MIRAPQIGQALMTYPVSLVDIAPALKWLASASETQSTDFGIMDAAHPIYMHDAIDSVDKDGVRLGAWKYIRNLNGQNQWGERVIAAELYRLDSDPGESNELTSQYPIAAQYLADLTETMAEKSRARGDNFGAMNTVTTDPELTERLKALGYLE